MKKIKLLDAILLFVSLGLLAMFVDQIVYLRNPFADSYFFLMFGMAGLLIFLYRRGNRILKDKEGKK
ncbi:hypothetical protein [Leadbetterella sp. DM7]|uniref:hypothetical protein n=1 Tax=Leadbetterella sp. DM7 TaxID=3235085 RepID=UPI00349E9111